MRPSGRILMKIVCVALTGISLATLARATEVDNGVELTLNFVSLSGDADDFGTMLTDPGLAWRIDFTFSPRLVCQTGICYLKKGGAADGDEMVEVELIGFPLLAKLPFAGGKGHGIAGIELGLVLSSSYSEREDLGYEIDSPGVELAIVLGGGAMFELSRGRLTTDLRCSIGLTDMHRHPNFDFSTRALSLATTYWF
jgi:hypothetical protein